MTRTEPLHQGDASGPALHRMLGIVLHAPRCYDLMVRLALRGRERPFRERLLALSELRPGETMLDIGCGTGSLAVLAKRQVGEDGAVWGIDASSEMIGRARTKARRAGVEAEFRQAPVQALPFPDAQFDVLLSTLMLHHVPRPARARLASEARRVLKTAGRILVVDFERGSGGKRRGLLHQRYDHVAPREIVELLAGSGFNIASEGRVGVKDLYFVLATAAART